MKYFILPVLLSCISCNHVKKITNKQTERSHFKEVQDKDSLAVSEDFTRLQHKYFADRNKSLLVSFFPKASALMSDSLRIIDSNGSMIIHMGTNTPSALVYTATETTVASKDSVVYAVDSITDRSVKQVVTAVAIEKKASDKKSDRVPWYLIVIVGVLLLIAAVLFRKMTSIPGVQMSDTKKA